MIVYDLSCDSGHRFEGWFGSSNDFADQRERGLLSCPQCGSAAVKKAPMAPAVPKKGNQPATVPSIAEGAANSAAPVSAPAPAAAEQAQPQTQPQAQPVAGGLLSPEAVKALTKLAELQNKALEKSTNVGEDFANKSRAMHYGEEDEKPIHGQASPEEAQDLLDEGIAVAPLPFPVAKPDDLN